MREHMDIVRLTGCQPFDAIRLPADWLNFRPRVQVCNEQSHVNMVFRSFVSNQKAASRAGAVSVRVVFSFLIGYPPGKTGTGAV